MIIAFDNTRQAINAMNFQHRYQSWFSFAYNIAQSKTRAPISYLTS